MNRFSVTTSVPSEMLDLSLDLSRIRAVASHNIALLYRKHSGPLASPTCFAKYRWAFSIDGSIKVPRTAFEENRNAFFTKSDRFVEFRGAIHLRGGNYTISANPTYELREKIEVLQEDFSDALMMIQGRTLSNDIYLLGTLDYLKNISITLLNGLIYGEKIGYYHLESPSYQSLRKKGIFLAYNCTEAFYRLLAGVNAGTLQALSNVRDNAATIPSLCRWIVESYQDRKFSSRHLVRPEAAHPLLVLASAALSASQRFAPSVLIGLPAGGTELVLAHKAAFKVLQKRDIPVQLVPVSMHSSKEHFDGRKLEPDQLRRYIREKRRHFVGKSVLIVDDNSSTGGTISMLCDALEKTARPAAIKAVVAEADVIRSRIDYEDQRRPYVAHPSLYRESVGVLPVSRTLKKKLDLKELVERRKMLCDIRRQYPPGVSIINDILKSVESSLVRERTEEALRRVPSESIIFNFKGTFLSNFWPCKIRFHSVNFNSVEHAYQAAKFEPGTLESLSDYHIERVNRRLERRGERFDRAGLMELFASPEISAGSVKIAANELRIIGLVRPDWDRVKFYTMAELLIEKFSIPYLRAQLEDTRRKYLIEGNDWGDTLWGVVEGRGRNILGRMLMTIRDEVVVPTR